MKKIIVASKNPVKINAALNGFQSIFPEETFEVIGVSIPSQVSDQPRNEAETYQGAWNRADGASREIIDAHYWVGIEGGIEDKDPDMEAFAWVVIKSADGVLGKGRTGTFFLPPSVADLIRLGKELGDAIDVIFSTLNIKKGSGAVGLLTGNVVDRTTYYTPAVVFALIPFKNTNLY